MILDEGPCVFLFTSMNGKDPVSKRSMTYGIFETPDSILEINEPCTEIDNIKNFTNTKTQ